MRDGSEAAIVVEKLSKVYPLTGRSSDPLRALFRRSAHAAREGGGPLALDGIDLTVTRGASLGIVGRNGSGKSTLLRVLSGTVQPSAGRIRVIGRVSALLDLGTGIGPDFTGRENAMLLGVLAGHTRREVAARMDGIHAWSGLEAAFDRPVRTYSNGMILRLAFSTAVHTDPDVLLIDETLAVGDVFFQQRCLRRIHELRASGCTIVLVSHDPSAVAGFCDDALWLEHGRVVASGEPARVLREYLGARYRDQASIGGELLSADEIPVEIEYPSDEVEPALDLPHQDHRYGDGHARLAGVAVRDAEGKRLDALCPGQRARVVVTATALARLASPIVGFTLRNRLGDIVTATNSQLEGLLLPPLEAGDQVSVEFALEWPPLASGPISVSPAIADGSIEAHRMCDWIDNALVLNSQNPRALFGWMSLEDVTVRAACVRARSTAR